MRTRRRGARRDLSVRTIEVPVPKPEGSPYAILVSRLGEAGAGRAIAQASEELGLPGDLQREVSAALVLTKLGVDFRKALGRLAWRDFEDYCAVAMADAGFQVSRNVRLVKPTRQIDIIAASPSLVLSVDCKHWGRAPGGSGLESLASAQAERTLNYAKARRLVGVPLLPVLVTLLDGGVKVAAGVPVVPVGALKGFLASVSAFEEGFAYVRIG